MTRRFLWTFFILLEISVVFDIKSKSADQWTVTVDRDPDDSKLNTIEYANDSAELNVFPLQEKYLSIVKANDHKSTIYSIWHCVDWLVTNWERDRYTVLAVYNDYK